MRRAPPKKGDQAIGRSRGGLTTKIHALVEGLGNLGGWMLTGGQAHDCTQACPLLEGADTTSTRSVTADKAYDTNEILTHIKNKIGAEAVILRKPTAVSNDRWISSITRAATLSNVSFAD